MLDEHMAPIHIGAVTLDEYLIEREMSEAAFGGKAGLSQSQVNRIRYGDSWPTRSVMERIRAATGQRVTPNDFLTRVARPKRRGAELRAAG